MTSPLAEWLRFLVRHWFVLPPAALLCGLLAVFARAWNDEPQPRRAAAAPAARSERPLPPPVFAPVSVFFVVDCSRHVAADPGPDGQDRRAERVRRFIEQSAAARAHRGGDDRLGVITFDRRPRVVVPLTSPAAFRLPELTGDADAEGGRCDVGAALALALESFPETGPRRIVLLSAGVDEVGDAREQAWRVCSLGVQIDVLSLGAGPEGLALLEALRTPSGGRAYREDASLDESARYGDVFRAVPALTPPQAPRDRPPSRSGLARLPAAILRRS